jgi:hypothetical protein
VSGYTRIRVRKILKTLEDDVDLQSLLRFLVPAFFGNLPDRRGNSYGIKAGRFWWSLAPQNLPFDIGVVEFGKGDFSCRELETETIGTGVNHNFGKQTHLYNDHRQGVHIGLIRRFYLLGPYDPHGFEELGGAVTERTALVRG